MLRFVPALLLFLAVVASAPAIGHLRDLIFETFPGGGLRALGLLFAVLGGGLLLLALVRIRHHRWRRYGGLLVVLALLWLQGVGFSTDDLRVDLAEKVHIVEYGALAILLYRALRRSGSERDPGGEADDPALVGLVLLWGTIAGTLEEGVQWLVPQRVGEVRDVALNILAVATGLVFAFSLAPPARWSWRLGAGRRRLLLRTAAAAVLGVGLFVAQAHLGHEIEDPEIGRFRSRFTADELRELSHRRRLEWAASPPTELPTWAIEDGFLTEAARHAGHRNSSYEHGNLTQAWLANRILEKHYDPFLDLESFRGSGRHRYPPAVRRDLEAGKSPHDPSTYQSPVGAGRILPWSKPYFLAGVGLVVTALWIAAGVGSSPPPTAARRPG